MIMTFRTLIVLSVVGFAASNGSAQKCRPVPESTTTFPGGNELIAYENPVFYKSLSGQVVGLYDRPLGQVLVEVFDNPEWIATASFKERATQKRLSACITSKNGNFAFEKLGAGRYELRISRDNGWNTHHVLVRIGLKADGKDKPMKIRISPAH